MVADKNKINIARARACMGTADIVAAGMKRATFVNILTGKPVRPETMGHLAKILNCDVLDLIKD